jgi:CAAX amino terminal protease family protein
MKRKIFHQKNATNSPSPSDSLDQTNSILKKVSSSKNFCQRFFSSKIFFSLFILFWVFGVTLLTQYIITYPMYWLLGRTKLAEPFWTTLCTALVYILSVFIIIKIPQILNKKFKSSREELGLTGLLTYTDIGISILGYIITVLSSSIILALLTSLRLVDAAEPQTLGYQNLISGSDRVIAYFGLAIIAPIAEEVIFRGWLYGKIRKKIPLIPSIVLVSILFGFLHGQWNVSLTVGILSVVNCLEREITGTIYAGILTHIIQNSLAFAILIMRGLL